MKQITAQQIESVMNELVTLNIPVKSYIAIQKLFASLPPAPKSISQNLPPEVVNELTERD